MELACQIGINVKEGHCSCESTVQRILESNRTAFQGGECFLKECYIDIRASDPERERLQTVAVAMPTKPRLNLLMLVIYCGSCFFTWYVTRSGNWKVNYLVCG